MGNINKENIVYKEFIDLYNIDVQRRTKTSTQISNAHVFNALSKFHDLPLHVITTATVKEHLESLLIDHKVSYVNKIKKYFNKTFNWGIENNFLIENPCKTIREYKIPDVIEHSVEYYSDYEWNVWDKMARANLRNNPRDFGYYIFINIMYFMGMRTGEVRALGIEDIDLTSGYIKVYKTCTTVNKLRNKNGFIITSPKNKSSYRTIGMPKILIKRMKLYFDFLRKQGCYKKEIFLFGNERPYHLQTIESKFKNIAKLAGIPICRPYILRHSHASLLINSGALDDAVAKRLGHSVKELRETYSHLYKVSDDNCINIINIKHPCKSSYPKRSTSEIVEELMGTIATNLEFKEYGWGVYCKSIESANAIQLYTLEKGGVEKNLIVDKVNFSRIKDNLFINL